MLRQTVMSKGGTTEAALDALTSHDRLNEVVKSAVVAARRGYKERGGNNDQHLNPKISIVHARGR